MTIDDDGLNVASKGALVLVATPIGNLGDLSPRAVAALADADMVCCEDTRRTRVLLSAAGIKGRRLLSLHGHNEAARVHEVLAAIEGGARVAVVSDAGMPGISDPGARLVEAAAERCLTVSVVPGPSAVVAALVASGLGTDRFCFEGFLPRRGELRRKRLQELAAEERTVVFFESPRRLVATLADLVTHCGDERRVAVARELTKLYEEIWRGTLRGAGEHFGTGEVRGEIVVVLDGAPPKEAPGDGEVLAALETCLAGGDSRRDAAASVAHSLGVAHRRAYALALSLDAGRAE